MLKSRILKPNGYSYLRFSVVVVINLGGEINCFLVVSARAENKVDVNGETSDVVE